MIEKRTKTKNDLNLWSGRLLWSVRSDYSFLGSHNKVAIICRKVCIHPLFFSFVDPGIAVFLMVSFVIDTVHDEKAKWYQFGRESLMTCLIEVRWWFDTLLPLRQGLLQTIGFTVAPFLILNWVSRHCENGEDANQCPRTSFLVFSPRERGCQCPWASGYWHCIKNQIGVIFSTKLFAVICVTQNDPPFRSRW